jgi:predicted GNAT family acetyltransferase
MRVTTYATADDFLAAVRPTRGEREAEHHLVLGVAESVVSGRAPDADLFAAAVHDGDELILAAFMTRERPLLIASDRDDPSPAAGLLWDAVAGARFRPAHVIGAVGQVDTVVREWERREGVTARLGMRQRAYRLTRVEPLPPTSGHLRRATMDDLDLLTGWMSAFEAEALAAVLPQSTRGSVERRITAGDVYLWSDPEPRTMAASARPTRRAIAVNGVYTPPAWRRRGYATACVAELSARLLGRFEFCVLYTDLDNPTSNAIYTRIGYRPVRDSLMYVLPNVVP